MSSYQRMGITRADLAAVAASIHEPKPRIWIGNRWICPQCRVRNSARSPQCVCGISRDGLPEFGEPTVAHYTSHDELTDEALTAILDSKSRLISEHPGEAPRLFEALAIIALPSLLTWAALIKLGTLLFNRVLRV
jgi:hypothetical protein